MSCAMCRFSGIRCGFDQQRYYARVAPQLIIEDFSAEKQVSRAWISNYIPQYPVGCNYSSMPQIPASGAKFLNCGQTLPYHVLLSWKYITKRLP